MVPQEFKKCLKRVLTLTFDERPPYEYIIQSLMECFINSVKEKMPIGPPSNSVIEGEDARE